jgi:hypothetical protein
MPWSGTHSTHAVAGSGRPSNRDPPLGAYQKHSRFYHSGLPTKFAENRIPPGGISKFFRFLAEAFRAIVIALSAAFALLI